MRPPRHSQLVHKATCAAIGAIEIYNKPGFLYREEAFAILNAKCLGVATQGAYLERKGGRLRSIEVWERRKKLDGTLTKRPTVKRNRAGNAMTIGVMAAAGLVRNYGRDNIDERGIENITLLMEIRDNAIHFHNASKALRKRVQEVGSAALRNFAFAAKTWFGRDLSEHDFALMPFAFESPIGVIQTMFADNSRGPAAKIQKMLTAARDAFPFDPTKPFNVGVELEIHFIRKAALDALPVRVSPDDPNAMPVVISEEDARRTYKWTYRELTQALHKRYNDFKENETFHGIRRPQEIDARYCHVRQLDSKNPKSQKQRFYNPNIVSVFDRHYTRH